MSIINQNFASRRLPDFRSLSVMLRILLGVNFFALLAALVQAHGVSDWFAHYLDVGLWVEPLLLVSLLVLGLLRDVLQRLPVRSAQILVVAVVAIQAMLLADFLRYMGYVEGNWDTQLRAGLLAAAAAGLALIYFQLRARALSPAVTEARLQALTARIRPHFLFNSLNAVLSLIRAEPKRAEAALEELAELFRALMRDSRDLVPLADEIALCRQYLDLEKLRLGERMKVVWQIDDLPGELRVPPLMLQPLLENAVYHGIEPTETPGEIRIAFTRRGDRLIITLDNPLVVGGVHHSGNRMALANIRERLALHYDLEASFDVGAENNVYRATMVLPCRH